MKKTILIATFLIAAQIKAAPYYRFWRGEKLRSLSHSEFREGLNDYFIPETVEQGRGKGLVGYLPAILRPARGIPHEIALVPYDNKAQYDALRKTPRGRRYGQAHWDYFERSKSKSLVPTLFNNRVQIEKAYYLTGTEKRWGRSYVKIRVFKRTTSESRYLRNVKTYLQSLKKIPSRLLNETAVIVARGYLVEYQLIQNYSALRDNSDYQRAYELMESVSRKIEDITPLRGIQYIGAGEALNTF